MTIHRPADLHQLSIHADARAMIERAREEGIETVWDRLAAQEPQCGYCSLGVSCRNCAMGPCRVDPFGEGPQKGVCGADADIIVARNLGRTIAAGASAHSDHGRDILEVFAETADGETTGYELRDPDKLRALAAEYGVEVDGRADDGDRPRPGVGDDGGLRLAQGSASASWSALPRSACALWQKLGIMPRGIDRENVEMLHRTHMGVDNDYVNILLHGLRTSLSDGWGGSMIATELSDILFGTPQAGDVEGQPRRAQARAASTSLCTGTTRCSPTSSSQAAEDPELVALAESKGRRRHQPGRPVLHRQRAADAQGHPDGRQPPDAGAGAASPAPSTPWSSTTSASCRRSPTWRSASTPR